MLQATARLAMESGSTPGGINRVEARMRTSMVHSELENAAHKLAFRSLSLRWHPDKFQAKYGSLLIGKDQEALMQHVCTVFQCLSSQWQSYVEAGRL